ncbi:unnamed protein product [Ectocarpus sp. 12 AP-2014]
MIDTKLEEIRAAVAECHVGKDGATHEARQQENARRIRVFKKLDAYAQDLVQQLAAAAASNEDTSRIEARQRELDALASTLVVRPVQPKCGPLLEALDLIWRVPAVMLFLLFMGFVVSIPLIMLTMVEQQIFLALNGGSNGGAGNSGGLSSILIRLDCAWLLLLMGIQVRAEFMGESLSRPAMLLFTHVSTLDAVVILGTLPRALCAVVKEELLAVPVLGWIMASRGAIPINRGHRASAVQALAEAAERARELQMFVAMAPEGTRSKTGQLGPFKKGAFHMQEQLQWPVIPVTIHGAYELFPLKWNVNQCGKVVVKYHRPIEAADIKSREGLSQRLRQEILEALDQDDVPEAGAALDPSRRAASLAATAFTYLAAARAGKALVSFSRREGVAVWALVAGAVAYVFLSTVFVFYVYARKCFSAPRRVGVRGGGGAETVSGGLGLTDEVAVNGGEGRGGGTAELSRGGEGRSREGESDVTDQMDEG